MKKYLFVYAASVSLLIACNDKGDVSKNNITNSSSSLEGKWTYRSLLNNTNVNADFDSLEFAAATIQLSKVGKDSLKGTILWAMDSSGTIFNGLNLTGKSFYNDTTLFIFKGYWRFYVGHCRLAIQLPRVFGSSLVEWGKSGYRFGRKCCKGKKHSCDADGNNCSPAGVVASTFMVKQ